MQALTLDATKRTAQVLQVPRPVPASEEVLIRVSAIALNPVDSLYVAKPLGKTGRVVGSDFAGTIEVIGPKVPTSCGLHLGSRVAGFLQGACSVNDRPGAFAEFLVCPWDLLWQVPDGLDLERAASVSLCGLTAAQSVIARLGLPAPFEWNANRTAVMTPGTDINFFIYSASTSVAMYAAQLVRRSAEAGKVRIRLFGAASKSRFEMLRAEPFRYDGLVDYHDVDWIDQIREASGGQGMHYALDCISEGQTVKNVSKVLAQEGRMAVMRSRQGGAWDTNDLTVEPVYGAVWEGLGEEVQYQGLTVVKSAEARGFAVAFYSWLSKGGRLESNPIRLMPGGLSRVVDDGFVLLGAESMEQRIGTRNDKWMRPIGAEKLVYSIAS